MPTPPATDTPATPAIDPETAWRAFAPTPENERLWQIVALLDEVATRAAAWLDDLPAESPLHATGYADEVWDDIATAARVSAMLARDLEGIAPKTPAGRAAVVAAIRAANAAAGGDDLGDADEPDEPHVAGDRLG